MKWCKLALLSGVEHQEKTGIKWMFVDIVYAQDAFHCFHKFIYIYTKPEVRRIGHTSASSAALAWSQW